MKRTVQMIKAFAVMAVIPFLANDAYAEDSADTTVMVYMIGSDLESGYGCATSDLAEMMASGCGAEVNLIVQAGGKTFL